MRGLQVIRILNHKVNPLIFRPLESLTNNHSLINNNIPAVRSFSVKPFTRKKKVAPVQVTPLHDYKEKVEAFFKQFELALSPILELNPLFKFEIKNGTAVLDVGVRGKFTLTAVHDKELLQLISPVSGPFEYDYDVETDRWLSITDDHDIRGMLTRDLIRISSGCLQF